jgi:hypothetical protein
MAKKINFVLKVTDAKLLDIKKALEAKNIKLDSIIEVYKEEIAEPSASSNPAEASKPAVASKSVSESAGTPPA